MIEIHELLYDDQFYFIISDHLQNGNLLDYIIHRRKHNSGPMQEEDVKHVARQIFSFLGFLHEKYIAHRDIKPDNIMIEKIEDELLTLKVIDFGFAEFMDPTAQFSKVLGSVHYMAPEVIKEESYDFKVDVWSATIIIYILLCEELPFFGAETQEIYDQIINKELDIDSEKWMNISQEAKSFLKMGLNKDKN